MFCNQSKEHTNNRDEIKKAYPALFSKHSSDQPRHTSFLDAVDLDSLRLSAAQFHAIELRVNAEMTASVPCDQSIDASTRIIVCDCEADDAEGDAECLVAVKQINKHKVRVGELCECRRDLRAHAHLQSANLSVVALKGWFEDAHRLCSLFEFARNGDLLSVLNSAPHNASPSFGAQHEMAAHSATRNARRCTDIGAFAQPRRRAQRRDARQCARRRAKPISTPRFCAARTLWRWR